MDTIPSNRGVTSQDRCSPFDEDIDGIIISPLGKDIAIIEPRTNPAGDNLTSMCPLLLAGYHMISLKENEKIRVVDDLWFDFEKYYDKYCEDTEVAISITVNGIIIKCDRDKILPIGDMFVVDCDHKFRTIDEAIYICPDIKKFMESQSAADIIDAIIGVIPERKLLEGWLKKNKMDQKNSQLACLAERLSKIL